MKFLCKSFLALTLSLCFVFTAFAASGVTSATVNIGGKSANVVYITLGGNRTIVPAISNNSLHTASAASSVISTVKSGTVVAAINGGFFDSYYNTSAQISVATGNYPRVYSTIVKDGIPICAGGTVCAVGMDYSGNLLIDRVKLTPVLKLSNNVTVSLWGANTLYNDPSAVYSLTDIMDYPINIPSSSKIITMKNNKITGISNGCNNYVVPSGYVAIVYGQTAYANALKWQSAPAVGDSAVYTFTASPSVSSTQTNWNNMRTVIAGGSLLVKDGKNMVDTNTSVTAADQQPDVVAQRSFIAKTSDGRLMLGTVVSSFRAIANSLISMGIRDAISLDGGASSMLYANGSYLTPAGRNLATVLAVVDESSAPVRPDTSLSQQVVSDEPSSWAAGYISRARSLNLLPTHLDSKYRQPITRKEFCDLIAAFIRAKTNTSIEYFCTLKNLSVSNQFTDSKDYYVPYVATLGIVGGYPDRTFRPKNAIMRQDAAIMLKRLATTLDTATVQRAPRTFADNSLISDYAKDGVDFVTTLNIMNGNADGTFSPKANITREQAIITMINAFDAL